MEYIVKNTIEEAEILNSKINNTLAQNIERYNATAWCSILTNKAGNQFAVCIETEGPRAAIINSVLTETEIPVTIENTDILWFDEPINPMGLPNE